jgi:hypothetical protein
MVSVAQSGQKALWGGRGDFRHSFQARNRTRAPFVRAPSDLFFWFEAESRPPP